jgi:hypothetical protein
VHVFSVQQEVTSQLTVKLVVFLVFLVNTTISLVCSFAKSVMRTSTLTSRIKLHAKFVWSVSSRQVVHLRVLNVRRVSIEEKTTSPVRNVVLQSTQIKKHRRRVKIATLESILRQEQQRVTSVQKVSIEVPVMLLV